MPKNVYISVGGPIVVDGLDSTNPSSGSAIGANVGYHVVSDEAEGEVDSGTLNLSVSPTLLTQAVWKSAIMTALNALASVNNWTIVRVIYQDFSTSII